MFKLYNLKKISPHGEEKGQAPLERAVHLGKCYLTKVFAIC